MRSFSKSFQIVMCVVVSFVVCGDAYARYDEENVRRVITEMGGKLAADPDVPGLSIAVLQKGGDRPVAAAFGTACIENSTPMTVQSRFKIGSVTKVYTAALTHRFIEEGRLAYDTPLDSFFPGFSDGGTITVRHLLEHTSGIADMLALADVRANVAKYRTPQELITMVERQPLAFQPGTQQAYCNTGFLILAEICERVSGKSYEDLVQEMFTHGLGMGSLVPGNDTAIVPRQSCGYTSAGGAGGIGKGGVQLPMAASLGMAKGTGNLQATPSDVVRLVNLDRVLKDDVLGTVALEPLRLPDGRAALKADKSGAFSMGELDGCSLFLFHDPEMKLVGKLGLFPGFGTAYLYDRQTGIAVAISVNNERAMPLIVPLGAGILRALRD